MLTRRHFLLASTASILAPLAHAQDNPDWTAPHPPFRIWGNLYYVGSGDLASYLIATPSGHILINSSLISSPPLIRRSVEQLGFHWGEVRILLISHAHYDHCAGSAAILRETGAQYMVMDGDVAVVESGGASDFYFGSRSAMRYPPAHVSRTLHDGEIVRLGDATLTAHKTAGHTKGCTSWSMPLTQNGRTLNAVIVGSQTTIAGYKLLGSPAYPQIAQDYEQAFQTLEALPCDLFLASHGSLFDLAAKYARLKAGDSTAFVDPAGYHAYLKWARDDFHAQLARQHAAARG